MGRLWSADGAAVRSTADIAEATEWLRSFLAARDVPLASNGYLRDAEAAVVRYLRWRAGEQAFATIPEQLACVREVHAFVRVARALRRSFAGRAVVGLDAKVRELRDQAFGLQGATTSNHSRNTVWELFVGAVLIHVDPELRFDEPDIRLRFVGADWGIACKLVTSKNVARHRDRLREAAEQIEDSGADFGLAWVNVTPLVNHDTLLAPHPDGGVLMWGSAEAASEALGREVLEVEKRWDRERFRARLGSGQDGRVLRKMRGAVIFAESVMGVRGRLDDQTRTQFYGNRPLPYPQEDLVLAFNAALGEAT